MKDLEEKSVLIVGFARTGQAVVQALLGRVRDIQIIDDRPAAESVALAKSLGVLLEVAPDMATLRRFAEAADLTVVSPGVPPNHPIYSVSGSHVISEIELAYLLTDTPIAAITGTNGKTTVTSLVASMLSSSGLRTAAVGNIGEPLIEVVESGLDVAVVEVSSFQLAYTETFRPKVATWLNFAEDHLDWHADMDEYAAAKARIWQSQQLGDIAVANRDDPVVWSAAQRVASQVVSFGLTTGDYCLVGDRFVGPSGEELAQRKDLQRDFPHDVMNALAALATARSAGASIEGCRSALQNTKVLPHRVELVATIDGRRFFDDSKATTPSAVIAALRGFSSVVLIAGGRNKGLDLGAIARDVVANGRPLLRGVVAIGDSREEVVAAFSSITAVERASTMASAVSTAARLAGTGDDVLLSPGCASFDWYRSYEERGNDFVRRVRELDSSQVESN